MDVAQKPSTELTALAWVGACLPLVLATFVHTARPSLPLMIPTAPRPALVFHQYQVDLGPIQPTSEVRGTFVFENRGSAEVVIDEITPSCGCLNPQISTRKLAPGEKGHITLRMQPANELPGKKEYFADLKYRDPEPQEVRVTFRLELPVQQLAVRPRALVVYQNGDEATQHAVTVADSRPQPCNVRSATINSPYATVELMGAEETAAAGRVTHVQVTVSGKVPQGRHEAIITIETDDEHSPILRVPVLIQGRSAKDQP